MAMADKEMRREIEELRAQMESLTKAGGQDAPPEASPRRETEAAGGWFHDIIAQAEELMGGLDLQFKDVPAKTALVIFALGVMMGRILSKRD